MGSSTPKSEVFPVRELIIYRGTSLIRKRTPLGPYLRPMPRVLGGSYWGGRFLMGEVPLYKTSMTKNQDPLRSGGGS